MDEKISEDSKLAGESQDDGKQEVKDNNDQVQEENRQKPAETVETENLQEPVENKYDINQEKTQESEQEKEEKNDDQAQNEENEKSNGLIDVCLIDDNKYTELAKNLNTTIKAKDKKALITEITKHDYPERQKIAKKYKEIFNKSLEKDIRSNIKSKFIDGVIVLLESTEEYEAKKIHYSLYKKMKIDKEVLIRILCTKEGEEIGDLNATYEKLFNKSLEMEITSRCKGYFSNLLMSILVTGCRRKENVIDAALATKEAENLLEKFPKEKENIGELRRIIGLNNFSQLKQIIEEIEKKSNKNIETFLEKGIEADFGKGCLTHFKSAKNRPAYFAELINESMNGLFKNYSSLSCILATRLNIDLDKIKIEYKKMYKKSLHDELKAHLNDQILLAFIGEDN